MVKNERGGVRIKTIADGCRASLSDRWDRSSTPTHPERSSFLVFTGIPQNEPCTFKLHHQPSPEQLWKEDLGLGWASSVVTELPLTKSGARRENPASLGKGTIQPEVGRKDLTLALGVSEPASHSNTHMLPLAVSWPSSHLLCPHLLSDSQDCGAIYKTPSGPLTGSRRRVMGPSLDCGPLGGADQPSSSSIPKASHRPSVQGAQAQPSSFPNSAFSLGSDPFLHPPLGSWAGLLPTSSSPCLC